ncbi:DUF3311 domain-containing protein [Pirellulaceae bacterium]|jgi:hypothetical protein|nr:DUF3311 domain-containing protein [Pirellulaceae bacterium]
MKNVVWGLVILLIILHQDFWFWENDYAVFGFIPMGLFYHAMISVGAGITWYLATVFAWPEGVDNVQPEYVEAEDKK